MLTLHESVHEAVGTGHCTWLDDETNLRHYPRDCYGHVIVVRYCNSAQRQQDEYAMNATNTAHALNQHT